MVSCCHDSCGREEMVWLPIDNNPKSEVSLHYWCILCGLVKNISDDRPHRIGYWMNILSKIARECLVTQSQKRLVVKELESYEAFDDLYGNTGSAQKEVFVKAVKKHCSLCESTIDSFIY